MYTLFFDGASRQNPGPSSCGGVIYDSSGDELTTYSKYIGTTTNNIAEYNALLIGVQRCKALNIKNVKVFGDSNLVIKQINGEWRVKNPGLRPLHKQIKEIEPFFTKISYEHVYRKYNKRADELANEALDDALITQWGYLKN